MKKLLGLTITALLISGCVSNKINHYTLTSPELSTGIQPAESDNILLLQDIDFPEYLESKNIIIRQSANEVSFSELNRWADSFDVEVRKYLIEHLRSQLKQTIVTTSSRYVEPTQKLKIEIINFEKNASANKVVLAARWFIFDSKNNIKNHGSFNESARLTSDSYTESAAAHSLLLKKLGNFISKEL